MCFSRTLQHGTPNKTHLNKRINSIIILKITNNSKNKQ